MGTIAFSTKARTLKALCDSLTTAQIAPLSFFTVADWKKDQAGCVARVERTVGSAPWIVRSSAKNEDQPGQSNAGAFLSIPNVSSRELRGAVDKVILSYGAERDGDEVLVQPMLRAVECSGVAFTADPSTGAPYRVIEWADGADTSAVTSGRHVRRYFHARHAADPHGWLAKIIVLLTELESMFAGPLDVEFAVCEGVVYLLQVRPLVMVGALLPIERQVEQLTEIAEKVAAGLRPHAFLYGRRTAYGVMPDWNPAEIIGIRPRPLALSLYRELITDSIWAYQRSNYGYKNLRGHPLLRHFHGLPYIDIRVCFNSFVPRDINDDFAERLVDHYLDRLEANPELHDKVEFEIVFSCYSLDLPDRLSRLRDAGFTDGDCLALSDSLRRLTNRIINAKTGLWRDDQSRIATLADRRERLYGALPDPVSCVYWLLEDCKRYGTLPFAGLARAGFIAVQMLRSLVSAGVLSNADHDRFINSLNTVSGQLPRDLAVMERGSFLSKYGHLRPGTYDILSARYDQTPERYFDWGRVNTSAQVQKEPFFLSLPQIRAIGQLLRDHELDVDAIGLFDFLQAAIELRESSKFEFTRNLSDALVLLSSLGAEYGFTDDDISFVNVSDIFELHAGSESSRSVLEQAIDVGRSRYARTCGLILPPLIFSERDVWSFEIPRAEPNFITQRRITADVAASMDPRELDGKIVCIRSADPGFDWLFSHPIAGLITAYGGANSHMAIRANELGLPSIIGAGEVLYERWSSSLRLSIDCANRKVDVLC